jgi:hypothetical protein
MQASLADQPLVGDSSKVSRLPRGRTFLARAAVVAIWVPVVPALALVGGIIVLVAIVGTCAAGGVLLYLVAKLAAYAFGFSFRWGLVTACGLFFAGSFVGGAIHDIRLEVASPQTAERETTAPAGAR